ncbi:NAD(P)-dependent oxidoreductase [Bradyrhizobium sp. WSM3983]|uniref:NAD(P)-dependent oxidoreductase n=1 Tax=Bradyrhizobium sp. WSM3983 TaxID=1038867 RepID=UPI0004814678|nr:NAD(P)-dependent oxidoreductase [Bradyrhizobium sp. WSM3983]
MADDRSNGTPLTQLLGQVRPDFLMRDGFAPKSAISEAVIFAHIHCLPSSVELLSFLIEKVGFDPSKIIVIPKAYSTIPNSLQELKRQMGFRVLLSEGELRRGLYDEYAAVSLNRACEIADEFGKYERKPPRVVLLDDGGTLTERWFNYGLASRFETVSVQQTTSGLFRPPFHDRRILKVNVAGSAAKRWFESKIIAKGITRKVFARISELERRKIGVVGYGAVGKALADAMSAHGADIVVYDKSRDVRSHRYENAASLDQLLRKAEVIFGCVGKDIFEGCGNALEAMAAPQIFASCSSRDVEFQSLFRYAIPTESQNPFEDVTIRAGGLHNILNGGFPINFDREHEWEEESEIALTRALVLAGVCQALADLEPHAIEGSNIVPLGVEIQKNLVDCWLDINGMSTEQFCVKRADFDNREWWLKECFNGP